jgi:AcrR family transcriptional regulator
MTATPELARPYAGIGARERVAGRRERLLDAAVSLFGTQGYAATGVKALCREAGLTDRYFYESFRDKAELFTAAFERAAGELMTRVAVTVAQVPPDPAAQARAAVECFVRALADDPRTARLLFVEAASVGGEVKHEVRRSLRRFADLVAAAAKAHVAGADVPDRVVTMAALSLVGGMAHVVLEWLDGDLDASVDELVDYFVDLVLVAVEAGERRR